MTRSMRLVVNTAFGTAFLAGALFFWSGVRAFVFSDTGIAHGSAQLMIGFALWTMLAGASRRWTDRQETTR